MRKRILAAGMIAMALVTGCGAGQTPNQEAIGAETVDTEDTSADRIGDTDEIDPGFSVDTDVIGVPSPYADYDSLEEAEEAAGFDLTLPASLDGADISACVISGTTIQVIAETVCRGILRIDGLCANRFLVRRLILPYEHLSRFQND